MTHQRKTIRDAVVTMLSTASIVASGKVYSNRFLPLDVDNLPILNVYSTEETSETAETTSPELARSLSMIIEARAAVTDEATIDDVLDDLAEKIEGVIDTDRELNGSASDAELTATRIEADTTGEVAVGLLFMTYKVLYLA